MSAIAWVRARVERVVEFIVEHAGPARTFVDRLIEAVKGLLRLDWRGEPVAAAGVVAVALVQSLPEFTKADLPLWARVAAGVGAFSLAVAASTQTRAKVVLPKKYAES